MKKSSLLTAVLAIVTLLTGCGIQKDAVTTGSAGTSVVKVNTETNETTEEASNKEKAADNTGQQNSSTQPQNPNAQKVKAAEAKPTVTPKPKVTPKATAAPKSEVTIKKYINAAWQYSYNYPSVFVTLKQEAGNQETFYNNTNDVKLTTSWLNVEGAQGSLEDWIKTEQQEHKTVAIIDKQISIPTDPYDQPSLPYVVLTWQDDDIMGNVKFIQSGDTKWSIEMEYPISKKDIYEPYFNSVINSFKIR